MSFFQKARTDLTQVPVSPQDPLPVTPGSSTAFPTNVRSLKGNQQTSLSNTTGETTIITAGAAGVTNDLYGLILANTGATTTKVSIRDATGGTVRAVIEVPTLETRGFMLPADSGMAQTAAAANWTAQCASATTALEVTALFLKSA